jgi:hypothetical protein
VSAPMPEEGSVTIKRFRRRLGRWERTVNVLDGTPIGREPAATVTPRLTVAHVVFSAHGLPRVRLTTEVMSDDGFITDAEIELPATGELAEAEPGDAVELRLVKRRHADPV